MTRQAITDASTGRTKHHLAPVWWRPCATAPASAPPSNVTAVLLATQTLHVSDRGYGLLLAGAAVGSVLGGVVNAPIAARTGRRGRRVSLG